MLRETFRSTLDPVTGRRADHDHDEERVDNDSAWPLRHLSASRQGVDRRRGEDWNCLRHRDPDES